jgi:hypothetical protein
MIITEQLSLADISPGALSRLVDELDAFYPDVMPDFALSEKEFAFRAGQVSVVRRLKFKLKQLKGED